MDGAVVPALRSAGLPDGTVGLVDSPERSAGWALFGDRRLSLAVARGSGAAVAQLGAVARQAGVAVSLHGTGGAWMVAGAGADAERFRVSVANSLDRKVCNTLNVCCIVQSRAGELVPEFFAAVERAAVGRGAEPRVHVAPGAHPFVDPSATDRSVTVRRADGEHREPFVSPIEHDQLGTEWEWEDSPEVSLVVVPDVDAAVTLVNRWSPRFVVSVISDDDAEHDHVYRSVDAPFVGDGFTRWVDGQYALSVPELGLSNWEGGRLLGRGAIVTGASVHTVRHRARVTDLGVRR
jgi:glutamate-5-semialdehyde dehydrogenase